MNTLNLNTSKKLIYKTALSIVVLMLPFFSHARTLVFQSSGSTASVNPSGTASQPQTAVVENVQVNQQVNPANPAASFPVTANSELFFMLEQLQQEVNTLRGIIEEQGHELRMLKQSSCDRYVDLDSRVLDLTKRVSDIAKTPSSASIAKLPSVAAPISSESKGVNKLAASEQAAPETQQTPAITQREATKAESDAYSAAYSLIKDKKFDDAILALFSYTENYPDSPLLPNVYYWLGEVYLASSKFEQAKTSFTLVMTAYPDNPKVSDAIYKLAVTLDRLGQKDQAKQYLAEVQTKYPNSSAAKLAENYTLKP